MNQPTETHPRTIGPAAKRIRRTLAAGAYTEADITAAGALLRQRGQHRPPRRQLVALFALTAAGAR